MFLIAASILLVTALGLSSAALQCNSYGYYCPSPTTFQLCPTGSGSTPADLVQSCPGTYRCGNGCTTNCVPATASCLSFTCTALGRYPDPDNCSKYVTCGQKGGVFTAYNYTCSLNPQCFYDANQQLCVTSTDVCLSRPVVLV